ncbi:MAG: phosphate ABC transporter substrate-binding protein PstS [Microbacteriaceae bacterium]
MSPAIKKFAQVIAAAGSALVLALLPVGTASATDYVPISGAGSSWSSNALDQWRRNVEQYGMRVNYASTGSSDGRNQFRSGTIDFAVSEIPYGLKDGSVVDDPPSRPFAYMPIVAGGTSFMYNLSSGGKQIANLRLSGPVIAKIFTGAITQWDDAAIKEDNPGIDLPSRKIVPVVRSDGSGSTAQFSTWMSKTQGSIWDAYCRAAGRATPCGVTSNYPVISGKGFIAQPNSQGVAGYVAQAANVGTITYVEYSYALKTGFPVVKVLNAAGYYVEPTASNVAVGLLGAKINTTKGPSYLTQILDGVYANTDKRAYPLSSYSYMIVPTSTDAPFTTAKGKTLAAFANYFLCEGQQQAEVLGYSPLPINLVKAGLSQVGLIPGGGDTVTDISKCHNPTFSADGSNTLAKNAPMPPECDKKGATQCATGTGGAAENSGSGGSTDSGGDGLGGFESGSSGGGSGVFGIPVGNGPIACNADTGVCQNVVASATNIDDMPGWGMAQTAMLIAVVLVVAIVFLPPILVRSIRKGRVRR